MTGTNISKNSTAASPSTIEWRYNRSGCSTCQKAESFLATHNIEAEQVQEAKKKALGAEDALRLARSVDEIYATKGSKRAHIVMKDKPEEDQLLAAMLGPTGNLRAPIIKKGRILLVGFDQENYSKVLT